MVNFIDLTGQKFSRLLVIRRDVSKKGRSSWLCKCDCGKETIVLGQDLKSGHTHSCGCMYKKSCYRDTRLYQIWKGMKKRCSNKKHHHYINYGGRGIDVCAEWKNDFNIFYDWAIVNGYTKNLTIDRIDVNGNYCPENCRWTTMKEQQRNRRNNHIIKGKTIAEWAEIKGVAYQKIYQQVKKGLFE